jgi:hypothetical protein
MLYFSSKKVTVLFCMTAYATNLGWGWGGVGRLRTTGSFFLVIYCHWHKVMSSNPTRHQCLREFVVFRRKNPVWGMGPPTGIFRWRRRTPVSKMNIAGLHEGSVSPFRETFICTIRFGCRNCHFHFV